MSVINKKSSNLHNIEFISYDGKYPNLCRGVLTMNIDGEIVKFGHHYMNMNWSDVENRWIYTDEDPDNPNYGAFWSSSGSCGFTDEDYSNTYINTKPWEIDIDELPEKFWELADELDRVINENIPYGCCGGCI